MEGAVCVIGIIILIFILFCVVGPRPISVIDKPRISGWQPWPYGSLPNARRKFYGPGGWWPTNNRAEFARIGADEHWPLGEFPTIDYPVGKALSYDISSEPIPGTPGADLQIVGPDGAYDIEFADIVESENSMARPWAPVKVGRRARSVHSGVRPSRARFAPKEKFLGGGEDLEMQDPYVDYTAQVTARQFINLGPSSCTTELTH